MNDQNSTCNLRDPPEVAPEKKPIFFTFFLFPTFRIKLPIFLNAFPKSHII